VPPHRRPVTIGGDPRAARARGNPSPRYDLDLVFVRGPAFSTAHCWRTSTPPAAGQPDELPRRDLGGPQTAAWSPSAGRGRVTRRPVGRDEHGLADDGRRRFAANASYDSPSASSPRSAPGREPVATRPCRAGRSALSTHTTEFAPPSRQSSAAAIPHPDRRRSTKNVENLRHWWRR